MKTGLPRRSAESGTPRNDNLLSLLIIKTRKGKDKTKKYNPVVVVNPRNGESLLMGKCGNF
jgi:hypothetical protein